MVDFLLNLVNVNENVDYSLIIAVIISYFLFIWFIICIWVFFDGQRRFKSIITSILFSLFSLLFGPPALIFYIMVRPEHTAEEDYYINLALSGEKELKPICFDGDKGFEISINLSVQPKESVNDKHKMMMQVAWMPQKISQKRVVDRRSNVVLSRIKTKLAGLFGNCKSFTSGVSKRVLEDKIQKKKTRSELNVPKMKKEDSQKRKTRKRKKKRRKKNKNKNKR